MTGRVLIVDDDDAARISLAALLEDEGFGVVEASTPDEARDAFAQGPYQVVLLDLHLDDESGLDLVGPAREAAPTARVLILSGEAAIGTEAGIDGWVIKGDSPEVLLRRIRAEVELSVSRSAG